MVLQLACRTERLPNVRTHAQSPSPSCPAAGAAVSTGRATSEYHHLEIHRSPPAHLLVQFRHLPRWLPNLGSTTTADRSSMTTTTHGGDGAQISIRAAVRPCRRRRGPDRSRGRDPRTPTGPRCVAGSQPTRRAWRRSSPSYASASRSGVPPARRTCCGNNCGSLAEPDTGGRERPLARLSCQLETSPLVHPLMCLL